MTKYIYFSAMIVFTDRLVAFEYTAFNLSELCIYVALWKKNIYLSVYLTR